MSEDEQICAEQISAAILSKLIIQSGVSTETSLFVLPMPIYYTAQERKAFKDMTQIAGLKQENVRIIPETNATTAFYGF